MKHSFRLIALLLSGLSSAQNMPSEPQRQSYILQDMDLVLKALGEDILGGKVPMGYDVKNVEILRKASDDFDSIEVFEVTFAKEEAVSERWENNNQDRVTTYQRHCLAAKYRTYYTAEKMSMVKKAQSLGIGKVKDCGRVDIKKTY